MACLLTRRPHCIGTLFLHSLLLLLPHLTASTTPENLGNLTAGPMSWRMWAYRISANFCQAVNICHDNGQEMIDRNVYAAMRNKFGTIKLENWWLGLVDALDERNTSKVGWMWIKDGHRTVHDIFASTEPNGYNNNEDCTAMHGDARPIWDQSCNYPAKVLCFGNMDGSRMLSVRSLSVATFVKVTINTFDQPSAGCWIDESSNLLVRSRFRCSENCWKFTHADCVGFYWNSARQQCIILPYFDAAVPLLFSSDAEKLQWEKFLRQ